MTATCKANDRQHVCMGLLIDKGGLGLQCVQCVYVRDGQVRSRPWASEASAVGLLHNVTTLPLACHSPHFRGTPLPCRFDTPRCSGRGPSHSHHAPRVLQYRHSWIGPVVVVGTNNSASRSKAARRSPVSLQTCIHPAPRCQVQHISSTMLLHPCSPYPSLPGSWLGIRVRPYSFPRAPHVLQSLGPKVLEGGLKQYNFPHRSLWLAAMMAILTPEVQRHRACSGASGTHDHKCRCRCKRLPLYSRIEKMPFPKLR